MIKPVTTTTIEERLFFLHSVIPFTFTWLYFLNSIGTILRDDTDRAIGLDDSEIWIRSLSILVESMHYFLSVSSG
jgi:hypothetical protein